MLVGIDVNQPTVIQNFNTEVLAISVDKLENKLHKLIPKVDKTSNWISAIGILIAIVLGIVSYFCVDKQHRPSLGLVIPLAIIILVALGFTIYLLYKNYHTISVENIIEELKKDDSHKTEVHTQELIKEPQNTVQKQSSPSLKISRGLRKKRRGKKR